MDRPNPALPGEQAPGGVVPSGRSGPFVNGRVMVGHFVDGYRGPNRGRVMGGHPMVGS